MNAKEFIAHECCQRWVLRLLYGDLHLRNILPYYHLPTWLKTVLGAVFVFPAVFWVTAKSRNMRSIGLGLSWRSASHRRQSKSGAAAAAAANRPDGTSPWPIKKYAPVWYFEWERPGLIGATGNTRGSRLLGAHRIGGRWERPGSEATGTHSHGGGSALGSRLMGTSKIDGGSDHDRTYWEHTGIGSAQDRDYWERLELAATGNIKGSRSLGAPTVWATGGGATSPRIGATGSAQG